MELKIVRKGWNWQKLIFWTPSCHPCTFISTRQLALCLASKVLTWHGLTCCGPQGPLHWPRFQSWHSSSKHHHSPCKVRSECIPSHPAHKDLKLQFFTMIQNALFSHLSSRDHGFDIPEESFLIFYGEGCVYPNLGHLYCYWLCARISIFDGSHRHRFFSRIKCPECCCLT